MRRATAFLIVAALAVTSLAQAPAAPKVVVKVLTDRPEAVYKVGETATFLITVTNDGKPVTEGKVKVALSLDAGKGLASQELDLGDKPAQVSRALDEPGFVRCAVTCAFDKATVRGEAGAAFEPERIKTCAVMPEDFDAFWAAGRAELAKIPLDLKLTPLPAFTNDNEEAFSISFANVDNTRMYGFITVPKKAKPPFPAAFFIPSAGVGKPREPIRGMAAGGVLCLTLSVHTHPLDLAREAYAKMSKAELAGYPTSGSPDREKFFFRRVILGMDRGIEYLASRPDFDGKHLTVSGSSQGGGMSLIMAGFNPRVTAASANVPALCDHLGGQAKRRPGWPGIVATGPAEGREAREKMSAYFDAANFARRITCPVIVSAGFIDSTCAPGSVYAAYNEIKAPKRMFNGPLTGHGMPPGFTAFEGKWRTGQLGKGEVLPPCK